jgi:hypothetical protein
MYDKQSRDRRAWRLRQLDRKNSYVDHCVRGDSLIYGYVWSYKSKKNSYNVQKEIDRITSA